MLHRQLPVATGHTLIAPGELSGKGGVPEQEDLSGCRDKVRDPLVRGAWEGRWLRWQVGAGTPCWARPGSGPGCWPLGVGVELLVAQQYPCQVQQPPGPPGGALLCWHLGLGAKAKRLRGPSPLLGGSGNGYSRSAHCQPPCHTLQESRKGAQVGWRVHVCVFPCVFPAQKGGPTGGRRACVSCPVGSAWDQERG